MQVDGRTGKVPHVSQCRRNVMDLLNWLDVLGVLIGEVMPFQIASFLNDQTDLFEMTQSRAVLNEKEIPKTSRDYDSQNVKHSVGDLLMGSKPLQLDLEKVKNGH